MTLVQTPEAASGHEQEPPRRRSSTWVLTVLALALVAIGALVLAPTGSKALYVLVAAGAAIVILISIRDLIGPPLAAAVDRLRPKPVEGVKPLGPVRTAVGAVVAAIAAGALAFVVADAGTKAMYGVVALVLLGVGLWLISPALALLVETPPAPYRAPLPRRKGPDRVGLDEAADLADLLDDEHSAPDVIDLTQLDTTDARQVKAEQWEAMGLGLETGFAQTGCLSRATGMFLAVMSAGMLAFFAAQMGDKALLALAGGILVVGCLVRARDKSLFMVFLTVCSLVFLLHKSFGPQDLTLSGGAPAVYVTSFDALLLLLYGLWVSEGTFVADVRAAWHRRILWVPLLGAVLMLPSLLVSGGDTWHSISELVRMSWMYLLFFYVAVRVRSRPMVWAILGGLGVFAAVEFLVVLLQWKTGGVLGLSFLGVPTQLTSRTTDTSALGRPFGTIIHPVFMGAAMGALGLLSFAFGLTLRRSLTKVTALAITAACVLCLYLSHTRAALVAFVMVMLGMIVVALAHKVLTWRTVGRVTLALLIGAAVFFPQLEARFEENFGTGHFSEEVTSRYQLNDLAGRMINDHPALGVGLNNFEVTMPPYEDHGIIFINNPVHNLYLLYLAETGIVGLIGLLFVGIAMYNVALRLARSRDRLLGGVGLGVSAAMAFLFIEELLGFSLRQDQPLALYWIFAGLAVACYRMSGLEGWRRPRHQRGTGRPSVGETTRGSDGPKPKSVWVPAYAGAAGGAGNGLGNGNGHSNRSGEALEAAHGGRVAQWWRRRTEQRVDVALGRAAHDLAAELRTRQPEAMPDELTADLARQLRSLPAIPTVTTPVRTSTGPTLLGRPRPVARPKAGGGGIRPWFPLVIERRSPAGRLRFGLALLLAVALLGVGLQQSQKPAQASTAAPVSQLKVVFAATSLPKAKFLEGIFEANSDGSDLHALLPPSTTPNTIYNWPQFALGGTKIVFTMRSGPEVSAKDPYGQYENIWMMDADGTHARALTRYHFRAAQPKVSADGRSVLFTAENPQAPIGAVYKLDLLTLEATSLSQVTQPNGSADADPRWTPDGRVVMSSTQSSQNGTAVDEFNADGTDRQVLVNDGKFNTDAAISPNGAQLAYSAFQGADPVRPGFKPDPLNPDDVPLNPEHWIVTVRDLHTKKTVQLTQGLACAQAPPEADCGAGQSSGWKPLWSPDGKTIAWTGRLNWHTTCICAANADGSDPRVLIKSSDLIIKWFEWGTTGGQPPTTAVPDSLIGSRAVSSQLLISSDDLRGGAAAVRAEPVDMMNDDRLDTGTATDPDGASWNKDRSEFVFVGSTPPLTSYQLDHPDYGPAPPPGQHVHEHFTLQEIQTLSPRYVVDGTTGEKQIFLHKSDGSVVQLTTPWTEDWRDAIDKGDVRSNTDPVISPDGRYVVFTNHSGLTGESFLLRMDLKTGAVLNLTNGTAGAMQVDDALPRFSPDSSKVAFTWTEGANTDVFVMNASDGKKVTHITDDAAYDMDPTWSPDGHSIVYSRHDGSLSPSPVALDTLVGLPLSGWQLVKVDVHTGHQTALTALGDSPAWRPVYAPEGDRIDFISKQYRTLDIFWTTPDGAPVKPLLITPLINETSIDWK